jgi:hypothetical protein
MKTTLPRKSFIKVKSHPITNRWMIMIFGMQIGDTKIERFPDKIIGGLVNVGDDPLPQSF